MPSNLARVLNVEDETLTTKEIAEMMKPARVDYDPSMIDFAQRINELLRMEISSLSPQEQAPCRKRA